ncbi:MAG: hypothetical protein N3B16_06890 [Candidatus Aminicenantes bacterium]|nr:hypothetical protein [Candidatus Aminicenantes bacterium]
MKRFLLIALVGCNTLLLIAGWTMAFIAYPRLPKTIILWVNFLYQSPLRFEKNLAFFFYPLTQLILFILFLIVSLKPKIPSHINNDRLRLRLKELWQEQAWTALIFLNLILIHLYRSLIFLSHGLKEGFQPTYFLILFILLFFLIPAYRLRVKMEMSSYHWR